jgi:hypothetical protein
LCLAQAHCVPGVPECALRVLHCTQCSQDAGGCCCAWCACCYMSDDVAAVARAEVAVATHLPEHVVAYPWWWCVWFLRTCTQFLPQSTVASNHLNRIRDVKLSFSQPSSQTACRRDWSPLVTLAHNWTQARTASPCLTEPGVSMLPFMHMYVDRYVSTFVKWVNVPKNLLLDNSHSFHRDTGLKTAFRWIRTHNMISKMKISTRGAIPAVEASC